MASKRRGGFRPPELRGTLGTLLRTTTGVVRDALERGAREGRARLDGARASLDSARANLDSTRANHRRHDALADLGELLLDLIRRGEVDLAELPEARDLVRELDQLDDDATAADLDAEPELPRIASRRRFDDRGLDARRPAAARGPAAAAPSNRRSRRDSDDGTVASGATWRPECPTIAERPDRPTIAERPDRPTIAERPDRPTVPDRSRDAESTTSRAPTKPIKGIWRPQIDDAPALPDARASRDAASQTGRLDRLGRGSGSDRPDHDTDRDPTDRPSHNPDPSDDSNRADRADRRPTLPRDPTRKGGISFDDEDLADYMHPDDVPPKPSPKDPDDHEA